MNQKAQRQSDKKPEPSSQLKQENIKPPNLEESKDKEPDGKDYVSHLFSYAAAAGGAGSAAPPAENVSSLLNGPLMTHPANQAPRQQTVIQLQQTLGNRYVQRMMDKSNAGIHKPDPGIQAKLKVGGVSPLTIGGPDDIYEKEADRIAEQVMRMPQTNPPSVQRQSTCPECVEKEEKELIQTKPIAGPVTPRIQRETGVEEEEPPEVQGSVLCEQVAPDQCEDRGCSRYGKVCAPVRRGAFLGCRCVPTQRPAMVPPIFEPRRVEELIQTKPVNNQLPAAAPAPGIPSISGGGQSLPGPVRSDFENRFGRDFSGVRIHTGSKAAETAGALNARAFTTGRNVVFGKGEYSPYTAEGKKLLAHELTHVVQQAYRRTAPRVQRKECPEACQRTAAEAAEYVDGHVVPRDCFVWRMSSKGPQCPKSICGKRLYRTIGGTGCAHWVAHQLGIRAGDKCAEGYTIRVANINAGRKEYTMQEAKAGDIWINDSKKHCGIVRKLNYEVARWESVDVFELQNYYDLPVIGPYLRLIAPILRIFALPLRLFGIPFTIPVPIYEVESVDVEHDSSASGGVVTSTFDSGTFWR